MTESQIRRLQWAVRATLVLGVTASVTANILHARPHPIAQAIAAWPPLALLITVELVTRIPVYRPALGVVRIVATVAIAGIAAWVSYWHMVGVVARYGEVGTVPYLLPLSADGLIIVASVSLVELAARLRDTTTPTAHPTNEPTAPAPPPHTVPEPAAAPHDARNGGHRRPEPAAATGATAARPRAEQRNRDERPVDHLASAHPPADGHHRSDTHNGPHRSSEVGRPTVPAGSAPADGLDSLFAAARTARDQLLREGHPLSRDALAKEMRRNGHAVRNNRASELLALLRKEAAAANSDQSAEPVNGHRSTTTA
ncbi:hypothetical protein Val02_66600 [Virgisporangium aliadipatigenens]|uniref:DUF2637 domain-containing protein n=1 Tax=Virgisporangium aliadipatigenens TaxID=741659 RepID=A0A8J3YQ68_9ACTN|nr:DUF2637 domain-containing protein [Virgisporangium aliadipatigenens]GIJ49774.1 hypothetical protein Val02_66600 [Virgisporangium aliadipatigenens]